MTISKAVKQAFQKKLKGEPVSWVRLGNEAGVHPERIRGKTRRLLKKHRNLTKSDVKVLVFDIETSPLVSYLWNRWQKFIPDQQVIEDWFVISWAAKWLFEEEVMSDVVTPEEALNRDDYRVTRSLWKLMDEADVLIAHNGLKFDIKMINGRFFKHDLDLPSPYQVIDTFRHATKRFRLPSSGLNFIAKMLGLGKKDDTDFQLWVDCMKGDTEALKKMDKYCKQDTKLLEDVYLKMRPYIQPHPNLGIYIESDVQVCPACGSDELESNGTYATTVNLYESYRCKCCGSQTRSRKSKLESREHITSSIPR